MRGVAHRSIEQPAFQVGGALGPTALYVERAADTEVLEALRSGVLCALLAPRQIGKSSLRSRAAAALAAEGRRVAQVDLTVLGTSGPAESWYFGLAEEIGLALGGPDVARFWGEHPQLSGVARFTRYLREAVAPVLDAPAVVFLDEIDSVTALDFEGDDLLAAIRALDEDAALQGRLTFCLLGVAAPGTLIRDAGRTPFNKGRRVALLDFSRREMDALGPGLADAGLAPRPWLDAIHRWTAGHPYMTLRLCEHLARTAAGGNDTSPDARVTAAVRLLFLERPFDDFNLGYARNRLLRTSPRPTVRDKLALYEVVRTGGAPAREDESAAELILSGVARRDPIRGGRLIARNAIFEWVFDEAWVTAQLARHGFSRSLHAWVESGRADDELLQGGKLRRTLTWAAERDDLTHEEADFLRASLARQADTQWRALWATAAVAVVALVAGAGATWALTRAEAERDRLLGVVDRSESTLADIAATSIALAEADAGTRDSAETAKVNYLAIAEAAEIERVRIETARRNGSPVQARNGTSPSSVVCPPDSAEPPTWVSQGCAAGSARCAVVRVPDAASPRRRTYRAARRAAAEVLRAELAARGDADPAATLRLRGLRRTAEWVDRRCTRAIRYDLGGAVPAE